MALSFFKWSQTASLNATADPNVNWAEGQSPSSVNDSARAMMASAAAFRDDIAGAITTGGTSTAYTVTSYQVFDTLAHLNGQMIAFVPHTTSTNAVGVDVTLNVDSLGAKSVRIQPSVALPGGSLVQGTPYVVTYNNSDGVFYLRGLATNPYIVPLGGVMDYIGTSAPNSSFVLSFGQAISRTTYATLFSLIGTTFGTGDGSTTFNVPDLRGRICAGKDDMGGSAASRLTSSWFGTSAASLGAVGGSEKNALSSTNQIPQFTPAGTISVTGISLATRQFSSSGATDVNTVSEGNTGGTLVSPNATPFASGTATFSGTAVGSASPSSFTTCQPTIIVNKILRII